MKRNEGRRLRGFGGGLVDQAAELGDESFHAAFENGQTVTVRFGQRLLKGPVIMSHAVAGDDGAGAVAPVLAMNEHRAGHGVDQGQHRVNLVLSGAREAAKWNVRILNAV